MAIFNFGKKKEQTTCDCGGICTPNSEIVTASENIESNISVKVLGSGCKKCNALESNVKSALKHLQINTNVEHVTDFSEIASYGVMSTPALVVNEKVVSVGKVLKTDEAIKLLQKI